MELLYFILTLFVLVFSIFYGISYLVHRSMTITETTAWDYGSYKDFIKQFQSISWDPRNPTWAGSFFSHDTDSQLHASIVEFRGKGMVIKFTSYPKYLGFMWLNRSSVTKRNKGMWK